MEGGPVIVAIVLVVLGLSALQLLFGPLYRVWKQRKQGEADFAQAQAETRIAVLRAHAELEASRHLAAADIERAKGIAAAIGEVEASLGGPEGYLRWKYIHMLEMQEGVSQIVYVPTEAGLPILEAGKRGAP